MITATGNHYDDGDGIDSYVDHQLVVQLDGDIVRVETTPPGGETGRAWGDPGVALELDFENARTLAMDILAALDTDAAQLGQYAPNAEV